MLAFSTLAQQSLIDFVGADAVELHEFPAPDLVRAGELMKKYEDRPMDLAAATLVVLAERLRTTTVFTLDRQDFAVFRAGRRGFRILPE